MPSQRKSSIKKRSTPGPKPDTLQIAGDWRAAVGRSLKKRKPKRGWPK
jgi:hypothetical protein